jgi:hypothetical protein
LFSDAAGEGAGASLLVFLGLVLVALTELQIGPLRRAQAGAEAATAFMAVCCLIGGVFWTVNQASHLGSRAALNLFLLLTVALFAPAAYRWGHLLVAAFAGAGFFLLIARTPYGRVSWVVVSLLAAPLLVRAGDSARLPPAHRRCCQALAVVALACLYLAVHLGSWDAGLVEELRDGRSGGAPGLTRTALIVATALVPALVVAWGVARRSRLLIGAGLAGVVASIVTLRAYVHVAPLWLALVAGGTAALVLALAIRRYLDSAPGRERFGFTADPLFTDPERRSALEIAAGLATFSPAAQPVERPGLEAGGGRFGGGGASGTY